MSLASPAAAAPRSDLRLAPPAVDHLPLDLVVYSPGLPHDGATLHERSLGGSETATIQLARCWAKAGHHVVCFAPQARVGIVDGVTWYPAEQYTAYVSAMPHDITIISRDATRLQARGNSAETVLWCHDLAHKQARAVVGGAFWQLARLVVQSEWQKQQYQSIYVGVPDDQIAVVGNGIDLDQLLSETKHVPRQPRAIAYGSRPERGLETALRIMEQLWLTGHKDIVLYSSTYESIHPPQMQGYYQALEQRARSMPNVRVLGNLKQADWHRVLAGCSALIYPGVPGEFREISCIVAMEATALGVPVVTVGQGAIPETIGGTGIVVGDEQTDVASQAYVEDFAAGIVQALGDSIAMEPLCRARGKELTWDKAAQRAIALFHSLLAARTNDPWRLACYGRRIGDVDLQ